MHDLVSTRGYEDAAKMTGQIKRSAGRGLHRKRKCAHNTSTARTHVSGGKLCHQMYIASVDMGAWVLLECLDDRLVMQDRASLLESRQK